MANFWKNLAAAVPGTVQGYMSGRKMATDAEQQKLENIYKQKKAEQDAQAFGLEQLFKQHSMKNTDAQTALAQQKNEFEMSQKGPISTTDLFKNDPEAAKALGGFARPDGTIDRGVFDKYTANRFSKTPEEIAQIRATTGKTVVDTKKTLGEIGPDPIKIREAEADIAIKEAKVAQINDPALKQKLLNDVALQRQKLTEIKNRPAADPFKALPEESKRTIHGLADQNAKITSIGNMLDNGLKQFRESQDVDLKIKSGQELLKILNSPLGSDAVGAEEVKRLGSFLEQKMLNLTQPGSMFGRDLDLFDKQLEGTVKRLRGSVASNQRVIDQQYTQAGVSAPKRQTEAGVPAAPPPRGMVRVVDPNGQTGLLPEAQVNDAVAEGWKKL